jgi:hypothetical protein
MVGWKEFFGIIKPKALDKNLSSLQTMGQAQTIAVPIETVTLQQTGLTAVVSTEQIDVNSKLGRLVQIKYAFRDWALFSKTHGVSNIIRLDSKLLKVIWMLCFLTSMIYCIVAVTQLLLDFTKYEVLINQQVENEAPVDFPAGNEKITIKRSEYV